MEDIFMKKVTVLLILIIFFSRAISLAGGFPCQFRGINYGPFHKDGQDPGAHTPIPADQIKDDLRLISQANFRYVKTYAVDDGLHRVVDLASTFYPDLRICVGVHESSNNHDDLSDPHSTKSQLITAIDLANTYNNVLAIVVGQECFTGDARAGGYPISVPQLANDLAFVRNGLLPSRRNQVILTTCLSFGAAHGDNSDSNGKLRDQLLAKSENIDIWMINTYPFYKPGGQDCSEQAVRENLDWNYYEFIGIYGDTGKQILVGEHGWPSAGADYGISHPSIGNESRYFQFASRWFAERNWSHFYFEMFDEPWKLGEPGEIGPHWGLYYKNGTPKFSLNWCGAEIMILLLD